MATTRKFTLDDIEHSDHPKHLRFFKQNQNIGWFNYEKATVVLLLLIVLINSIHLFLDFKTKSLPDQTKKPETQQRQSKK